MSCHASCRADKPGGENIRVRCSLDKSHEGRHYDDSVRLAFALPHTLKAGRYGST